MPKVKMLANLASADTAYSYYNGEVADLSEYEASRLVSNGKAEFVDEEILAEKSMDELKETADHLGVDVSSEKKKEDVVRKLANSR